MSNKKAFTILSALLFLMVILPFLVGSFYAYPASLHDWQMAVFKTDSFVDYITYIKDYFLETGGRVVSESFFLSINQWFTLQNYAFVTSIVIIVQFLILYLFFRELLKKEARTTALLITIFFSTLFFIEQDNVYEQNYVLSVIFTYHFSWYFFLLSFLTLLKYVHSPKGFYFYSFLFFFVLSTLTLEVWLILAFPLIAALIYPVRKQLRKAEIIGMIISIIIMLVCFLAPGNFNRSSGIQESLSVIEKATYAILSLGWLVKEWGTSPGLYVYTTLVFIFGNQAASPLSVGFESAKRLLILGVASICLVVILLVFANQGTTFPERLTNILFLYFLILWSVFIWTYAQSISFNSFPETVVYVFMPLFFLVAFTAGLSMDKEKIKTTSSIKSKVRDGITWEKNNISQMYKEWISGEWVEFKQEQIAIFDLLKETQRDTLIIQRKDYPTSVYDATFDLRARKGRGDKYTPRYYESDVKVIIFEEETNTPED